MYLTVMTTHGLQKHVKVFHYLGSKFVVCLQDVKILFHVTKHDKGVSGYSVEI